MSKEYTPPIDYDGLITIVQMVVIFLLQMKVDKILVSKTICKFRKNFNRLIKFVLIFINF